MPGHFPAHYPDELLYSLCARFASRAGYARVTSILEELFGTRAARAVIDLPCRLGHLATALPPNSSLTTVCLLDKHTLLPFFSSFHPAHRIAQLRDDLKSACGPAGHMRSGIMASRIPMPEYLRFCPACTREDEECFRETYWHRLHQLPGVEVCPSHRVFLENSSVGLRAGRKHLQFIPAEQSIRAMPPRFVDIENRDHWVLLQLARDVEWLLEHPSAGTSLKALHTRHLRLLFGRGLATYTGSIHVKKLLDEFGSYYSPALLNQLPCELHGSNIEKSNWLLRLVRPPKHGQHPLYHLLLIQFLGCTVEEFFKLPEELSPFGQGPWPCLNPAANHYRRPVIMECLLGDRLRYGNPTGKFSCECGFAYVRTGPDSAPEDKFHIGRTISLGHTWETELKRLWRDSSLSISEIGRRLGVDPLTVRRHAVRLKLPSYRSDKRLKPLSHTTQLKGKAVSAAWENKRHRCRSRWLSAMKNGQEITLNTLRHTLPREYAWLQYNDSEWLEGNKPRAQRCNPSTSSVDWKRRDAEYAIAVKKAASRIKEASGRPVHVTKTAIGRAIGAVSLLQQKLHKMPLTTMILEKVVETRVEYAVRRIWWAVKLFREENLLPQTWQLILKANVYKLRNEATIKEAIIIALQELKSYLPYNEGVRIAL